MSEYVFGMGDTFFITGTKRLWTSRPVDSVMLQGDAIDVSDETVVVMDTVMFERYDRTDKVMQRSQAVMLMTTRGFGWCWACDVQEQFMATKLAQEENK